MKLKLFVCLLVLSLTVPVPALRAEDDYVGAYNYADGGYDDARQVSSDSSAFDGGSGSTSNTSSVTQPVGDVPDIGPAGPVGYQDESGDYHSY